VKSSAGWQLRAAIVLAALVSVALVVYAIAIGVAARNSRGSSVTATGWEIAVYLSFAALVGLVWWGLTRRNAFARTPFVLTQAFVVIVGWTVFSGDGTATKAVGLVILGMGLFGVFVGFTPGLMAALEPEAGSDEG
jgi:hypothetical protein